MDLSVAQVKTLDRSVFGLVRDGLRAVSGNPALFLSMLKLFFRQRAFASRRRRFERRGLHVPPFMIYSVTGGCNLSCEGCYHRAMRKKSPAEMTDTQALELLRQSGALGIGIILLAGGEPLTRKGLFTLTSKLKNIIFPVFTNGLLIDAHVLRIFRKQRNVIPVISLEGRIAETDGRRGKGVYTALKEKMASLRKNNCFWGVSLTVTRENFSAVSGESFVREITEMGCRLFFYVEYMPVKEKTENSVPNGEQRERLPVILEAYRKKFSSLFISFPQDEEQFGGCLSSGRGFVHINPSGELEPCPFAPYSDTNITKTPLSEALKSPFLRKIRENHTVLNEKKGACALWENKAWVKETHRKIVRDNYKR